MIEVICKLIVWGITSFFTLYLGYTTIKEDGSLIMKRPLIAFIYLIVSIFIINLLGL